MTDDKKEISNTETPQEENKAVKEPLKSEDIKYFSTFEIEKIVELKFNELLEKFKKLDEVKEPEEKEIEF